MANAYLAGSDKSRVFTLDLMFCGPWTEIPRETDDIQSEKFGEVIV